MLTVLYAEFKLRPNAETVLRDTRRQVYIVLVLVVMSWVAECICILKTSTSPHFARVLGIEHFQTIT